MFDETGLLYSRLIGQILIALELKSAKSAGRFLLFSFSKNENDNSIAFRSLSRRIIRHQNNELCIF